MADNVTYTYCNLTHFASTYKGLHGYLSVLVCIFGSVTNVFNICVLTTREMRWPTNLILTGLAVTDLLVMLEYIPFLSHYYLAPNAKQMQSHYSYSWALFMIFHVMFTQICHFISCCLTVILAIWRYIAISKAHNDALRRTVTSIPRTLLTIFLTYLLCPLICLPVFITHNIKIHNKSVRDDGQFISDKSLENTTDYQQVQVYTISIEGNFQSVTFFMYGVVIKLVPCILLTILSIKIIGVLMETKKRRRLLFINCGVPLVSVENDCGGAGGCAGSLTNTNLQQKRHIEKEHQTDRTTRMLLIVLLLFLITEFPQAILGLMIVIYDDPLFAKQCYYPLGDLMDFLALTNSAINFVLYCSMSRQFRSAFGEIFKLKVCEPCVRLPNNPPTEFNNGGTTQVTLV
ncbi:G-protein coupled receptor dmsr-1-like [Atheta coriaria]|uniref:G-protein coupled receptor dmsr-1-like n=1 Tax=Dalotia coriaria TaxID=877792 RepID=UPI0031F3806D